MSIRCCLQIEIVASCVSIGKSQSSSGASKLTIGVDSVFQSSGKDLSAFVTSLGPLLSANSEGQ